MLFTELYTTIYEKELLEEFKTILTNREKEVLDLLLLGKTPDEIASEIKTTSRTVYNIMNKIKFKIKE